VSETSLIADMRSTPILGPADFATIEAPVLALYGERSDLRARGEACLRDVRRARVKVLEGCTHSVLWEATNTVRDLVLGFAREVAS
jgi:pimeloyl-ACP methyl ester carboxylesterase